MTTFWIKPSLEALAEWHDTAPDNGELDISIRCTPSGDKVTDEMFTRGGYTAVSRSVVEALVPEEDLDWWAEEGRLAYEKVKASGLCDRVRAQLERQGL